MGQRGPKKTPAAVKRARGTFRADRDAGLELPPGAPVKPPWLDERAGDEWDRRVPQLVQAGLLSPADQVPFGLFCQAFSQMVRCLELIQSVGYTTETVTGAVIQHPAVSILHKARSDLIKLAREFGMTPAARSGMKFGGQSVAADDPLERLERDRRANESQA
jgi:P27 family predicted phage terminase small subunit